MGSSRKETPFIIIISFFDKLFRKVPFANAEGIFFFNFNAVFLL